MNLQSEITQVLQDPSRADVKFLAVLPSSDLMATYIAAFANTAGGYLVLGASVQQAILVIHGITSDFNVKPITQKAISLLSPLPVATFAYITADAYQLFAIKVEKSVVTIRLDGREYKLVNGAPVESDPIPFHLPKNAYSRIKTISSEIDVFKEKATPAASSYLNHCLGLLRIADNQQSILFPESAAQPTTIPEGKIMSRIILSSAVDNFEVYLGELMYQICLARPETLKSTQTVTIEEVLNCSDIEEFVKYMARKKIAKFQKGSVREFIRENPAIAALQVLTGPVQDEIEQTLQIRHLFTHRNGIIDDKFILATKADLSIGSEYCLSMDELLNKVEYLLKTAMQLDTAAIAKYQLA